MVGIINWTRLVDRLFAFVSSNDLCLQQNSAERYKKNCCIKNDIISNRERWIWFGHCPKRLDERGRRYYVNWCTQYWFHVSKDSNQSGKSVIGWAIHYPIQSIYSNCLQWIRRNFVINFHGLSTGFFSAYDWCNIVIIITVQRRLFVFVHNFVVFAWI